MLTTGDLKCVSSELKRYCCASSSSQRFLHVGIVLPKANQNLKPDRIHRTPNLLACFSGEVCGRAKNTEANKAASFLLPAS